MTKWFKDFYKKYLIHFPDFLQYLILIVLSIVGAIFFL
jgi:hypothetical protein